MMTKTIHKLRTSACAIAASAVLSPTFALAQEVDPSTTVAVPVESTPVVDTPAPVVTDAPVASDPLSPSELPEAAPETTPAPVATTGERARTATPARTATSAPRAAVNDGAPAAATPVAEATPAPTVAGPVAPLAVEEVAPAPAPVEANNDDLIPIAAGAGVGLLAMLGAGMFMRRRKARVEENLIAHQPRIARTVVDEPASVTTTPTASPRPAFAFGQQAPVAAAPTATATATSGNRIEQALNGPTPDNPFLSLKKRLKRAAFFEQRDRQIREGIGTKVSPMAGLPRRLVDSMTPKATPAMEPTHRFQWA